MSICQLELDISSRNVSHGAVVSRGVHYKQKYVPCIGKGGDSVAHSFNCIPRYGGFVSCWRTCFLTSCTSLVD